MQATRNAGRADRAGARQHLSPFARRSQPREGARTPASPQRGGEPLAAVDETRFGAVASRSYLSPCRCRAARTGVKPPQPSPRSRLAVKPAERTCGVRLRRHQLEGRPSSRRLLAGCSRCRASIRSAALELSAGAQLESVNPRRRFCSDKPSPSRARSWRFAGQIGEPPLFDTGGARTQLANRSSDRTARAPRPVDPRHGELRRDRRSVCRSNRGRTPQNRRSRLSPRSRGGNRRSSILPPAERNN